MLDVRRREGDGELEGGTERVCGRERERGMNLLKMKEGEKGSRDLMTSSGETKRELEGDSMGRLTRSLSLFRCRWLAILPFWLFFLPFFRMSF